MIIVLYKDGRPGRLLSPVEPIRKQIKRVHHNRKMVHSPLIDPVRTDSWDISKRGKGKGWKVQKHARKNWMRHLCRIKKSVSHRIPIERCIFPDTHSF
jgi:hypothetical protein